MLIVRADAWRVVVDAARGRDVETCGALFGSRAGPASRAVVLPNAAPDARRAFVLDDLAHLAALRRAEADGLVEQAIWHVHLDGDLAPSAADREGALLADGMPRFPGVLLVVVSPSGAARAWSVERPTRVVEAPFRVTDDAA